MKRERAPPEEKKPSSRLQKEGGKQADLKSERENLFKEKGCQRMESSVA